MVDAFGSGEIFLLDVDSGIADPIALGPFLVTLDAGKGASEDGAAWAAIFMRSDVACRLSVRDS